MNHITVAALNYYPVKSCAGISLTKAFASPRGFINDRIFMIVDEQGLFITQRDVPVLALIRPELNKTELTLDAPGKTPCTIRIDETGVTYPVQVWNDSCMAVDQGEKISAWISEFIGMKSRLVIMHKSHQRIVDQNYALSAADQVGFSDGFPFLIISTASLEDLNSRMEETLPMDRFRPNIVIEGCSPYQEDEIKQIKIGEVVLDIVKPCIRCVITTIDQKTLQKSKEPLATLATYRRSESGGVRFGQNAIHQNNGWMKTGDLVQIIK
ncbi:MAG: MOSC domain-containing protein [Calditrichae bacterium]|nr:MOSC domain-containing protein [Calditrichota bacterium]MCB9057490.1 MOSC domain-containing protein [Calditrichia bacterium]